MKHHLEKQLTAAIKALGVKGIIRYHLTGDNKALVYSNNRYFGIFDFSKNTFVD